jgi:L-ascorbate metabolism protein UlaG (beta-lactamase superfamily)
MKSHALLLACAIAPVALHHAASSPARGSAPEAPRPFAAEALTDSEIFRGSFAPDGRAFYFFTKVGDSESYRVVVSRRERGRWSRPERVDLGGDHSDLYPSITRDGRRLVFSSYRPIPGVSLSKPSAHLWYSDLVDGRWSAPVFMARPTTPGHYHSWVHVSDDGAVYFRRTTPDWRATETRVTRWNGTEYAASEIYADAERWKTWRPDVRVVGGLPGPGGRTLFLDVSTTNPRTDRPASDIWVTVRERDGWSEPRPLGGGVNSDGFDVFPFFSPDGRELYFVRDFRTFHRVAMDDALGGADGAVAVRYVANSGMLVEAGGHRFLFDAPVREGIAPYATSADAERRLLESASPPYDRIDAILVTHWHEDHFNPEAVAAHLARSPRTVFVSSPEVVDRLRRAAPGLRAQLVRAVLPAPGASSAIQIGGARVHVLRLRHNPTRRVPAEHVGFLVESGEVVLHVGDADPVADNFAALASLSRPDIALLPFWYVTDRENRAMTERRIRPRRVVAMHAPPGDVARISRDLRDARFPVEVAATPGTNLVLAP